MSFNHVDINRPVHLARRDLHFERAVEMLCAPMQAMDAKVSLQRVRRVLTLLKTAQSHAGFAVLSAQATSKERDFVHFLRLIAQNVQSVEAMIQNQMHLSEEESFLCQFLGVSNEDGALPAMAYGRRADDILRGVWFVLQRALSPYRTLQQENIKALDEKNQIRYEKAHKSTFDELAEKREPNA